MSASIERARRGAVTLLALCAVLVAVFTGPAAAQDEGGATPSIPLEAVMSQEVQQKAGGSVRPPADAVTNTPMQPGVTRPRDYRESGEAATVEALSAQGVNSDTTMWGEIRAGESFTTQASNPQSAFLVQDDGVAWQILRSMDGTMVRWGTIALFGVVSLLFVFYMFRGRVEVEHGLSGRTIERFKPAERFGHWLLATSFILLAITGLNLIYGKDLLMPLIGKEAFALFSQGGKWIHNNIAWAFMVSLVWIFLFWVWHNLPSKYDIGWLIRAGGLLSKHSHPPSRKFNAGQKLIFWSTILLGGSLAASGLMLLFPYEIAMFEGTFRTLQGWGVEGWGIWPALGIELALPTELTPLQEVQYAQVWHTIVAYAMIVIIIAHIYIGSVGMQGAFDAMGSGQVDRNWAEEHHSIWVREADERAARKAAARGQATPAE